MLPAPVHHHQPSRAARAHAAIVVVKHPRLPFADLKTAAAKIIWMEIQNFSDYSHFMFEKHGRRGEVFDVIALRGTFDLVANAAAKLSAYQEPICMADDYFGEPESSSLRCESDLSVIKPATDIILSGHARSIGGQPLADWVVGLRVGEQLKGLRVTGPRQWHNGLGGWVLSKPEPTKQVPLRYELAFGGRYPLPAKNKDTPQQEWEEYPLNPVGCGFVSPQDFKNAKHIPAPQIEATDQPITKINGDYRPEGLGPISRWWEPRYAHAGTHDEVWQRDHYPDLPPDFNYAFYNGAHPDLIYRDGKPQGPAAYLQGDESYSLLGLFEEGRFDGQLPGVTLHCETVDNTGQHKSMKPILDTVIFDSDARTVSLVWRTTLPRAWNILGAAVHQGPPLQQN